MGSKWVVSLGLVLALLGASTTARAQGADHDFVIGVTSGIGVTAALVNNIATIIYIVDDRSFDVGWMISTLFSTSINGLVTIGLAAESTEFGQDDLIIPAVIIGALTLAPAIYLIRGATHEALPGEPFDPERRAEERARKAAASEDPFAWRPHPPPRRGWVVGLPALHF